MSWTALRFLPRDTPRSRAAFAAVTIAVLVLTAAAASDAARAHVDTGLRLTIHQRYAFEGKPIVDRPSTRIDLAFLDEDASLPRQSFTARWEGVWFVDRDRVAGIDAGGDDRVIVTLDDRVVVDRQATGETDLAERPTLVRAGWHRLSVFYEQFGGGASLNVRVVSEHGATSSFEPRRLFRGEVPPETIQALDRASLIAWLVKPLWWMLIAWWAVAFVIPAARRAALRRADVTSPIRFDKFDTVTRLPAFVAVVAGFLLVSIAGPGPDYGQYADWATAFLFKDLFLLRGDVGSPLGLPLPQAAHGPGLILGMARLALGPLISVDTSAMVIGGLAGIVFWWAAIRILAWAAEGNLMVTVWSAAAMFLGTHAGFYSHNHASESVALALVAYLVLAVVEQREPGLTETAVVGAAAGLLVVTRVNLAPYAAPALILHAIRLLRGWPEQPRVRTIASLVVLAVPLAVAATEIALANRWTTGSLTTSPYVFGDSTFRSMDWLHPEFRALLTSPWHGLFVYHPMYALGCLALVVMLVRATSPSARLLALAGLATVVLHAYVQAAWYVWWMGTTTFGSRGMTVASVVVMAAVTRAIARTYATSRARGLLLVGVATACALWSFLMLLQGASQFLDYNAVIEGQRRAMAIVFSSEMAAVCSLALPVVVIALVQLRGRTRGRSGDVWLDVPTVVLGTLVFGYLLRVFGTRTWFEVGVLVFAALLVGLMVWTTSGLVTWRSDGRPAFDQAGALVRWGIAAVFVATTVLFAITALDTERRLASGDLPRKRFSRTATFQVHEVLSSYSEYRRIAGFEDKKEALRRFLKLDR